VLGCHLTCLFPDAVSSLLPCICTRPLHYEQLLIAEGSQCHRAGASYLPLLCCISLSSPSHLVSLVSSPSPSSHLPLISPLSCLPCLISLSSHLPHLIASPSPSSHCISLSLIWSLPLSPPSLWSPLPCTLVVSFGIIIVIVNIHPPHKHCSWAWGECWWWVVMGHYLSLQSILQAGACSGGGWALLV